MCKFTFCLLRTFFTIDIVDYSEINLLSDLPDLQESKQQQQQQNHLLMQLCLRGSLWKLSGTLS